MHLHSAQRLRVCAQIILHQEHEKEKERELILSVLDDGEEVQLSRLGLILPAKRCT